MKLLLPKNDHHSGDRHYSSFGSSECRSGMKRSEKRPHRHNNIQGSPQRFNKTELPWRRPLQHTRHTGTTWNANASRNKPTTYQKGFNNRSAFNKQSTNQNWQMKPNKLSKDEADQLHAKNRCFECKEQGHMA
jgi:hypothetical protein